MNLGGKGLGHLPQWSGSARRHLLALVADLHDWGQLVCHHLSAERQLVSVVAVPG